MPLEFETAFAAIGAFYVISAAFMIKMTLRSFFLEKALYGLSETPTPFWVRHQSEYILSGVWLVGMSGLLTFFRIDAVVWLWCLAVIHQAVYLFFLAPYKVDPIDPPELEDRKRTRNAFWLYCAFGGLIVWAYSSEVLRPLSILSVSEKVCLVLGFASLTVMALWWLPPSLKWLHSRNKE
jgi:hypothetical protein